MKGGEEKSGDNPQGGKHKNPGMLEIKSCQLSPHYATRKSALKTGGWYGPNSSLKRSSSVTAGTSEGQAEQGPCRTG
jgi:hypothetical protein